MGAGGLVEEETGGGVSDFLIVGLAVCGGMMILIAPIYVFFRKMEI